jgi:hypothetical protein
MKRANIQSGAGELVDLFSRVQFSHESAERASGANWDVYIRPWIEHLNGTFDFTISVTPIGQGAVLHGNIPRFAVEAIEDPRLAEGVAGRVGGDIEKNLIERWTLDGTFDSHGIMWLRNLPPGWYSLHLGTMATKDVLGGDQSKGFNAAALRLAADDSRPPEVAYHLADRRIVAYLRAEQAHSMLKFVTKSPDLKGTRIRYQVAGQKDVIPLDRPDGLGWCATAIIERRLFDAQACVPEFSVA